MDDADSSRAPVVLVGLGNALMSDEGIGVHIVNAIASLSASPSSSPADFRLPTSHFECVDLGTSGMAVMHEMAGRRRAVIVDCAFMDEPPGAIRSFAPEDVDSRKRLSGFSVHEGDLLQTVRLSRAMGECPEDIVLFGIQPADVSPGTELSDTLRARLPEYIEAVLAALREGKEEDLTTKDTKSTKE